MKLSARYWDRIAERYSRQPVADEDAYRKKLEISRTYLRPDMEALEFGCGTGSTALAHAPYVKHILATDISPRMIEIARRKANAENIRNVTFQCATLDDCQVPDETLDAVFALNILHLLADRNAAIDWVYRRLKPGGVFISSTACIRDMKLLYRVAAPVGSALGFFPLVRVFAVSDLRASLTKAGFRIDVEWLPGKNTAVFMVAKKDA